MARNETLSYSMSSLGMNELLADSVYRHVTEEPGEWPVEKRAQAEAFYG
jgi:hypothetical protein